MSLLLMKWKRGYQGEYIDGYGLNTLKAFFKKNSKSDKTFDQNTGEGRAKLVELAELEAAYQQKKEEIAAQSKEKSAGWIRSAVSLPKFLTGKDVNLKTLSNKMNTVRAESAQTKKRLSILKKIRTIEKFWQLLMCSIS